MSRPSTPDAGVALSAVHRRQTTTASQAHGHGRRSRSACRRSRPVSGLARSVTSAQCAERAAPAPGAQASAHIAASATALAAPARGDAQARTRTSALRQVCSPGPLQRAGVKLLPRHASCGEPRLDTRPGCPRTTPRYLRAPRRPLGGRSWPTSAKHGLPPALPRASLSRAAAQEPAPNARANVRRAPRDDVPHVDFDCPAAILVAALYRPPADSGQPLQDFLGNPWRDVYATTARRGHADRARRRPELPPPRARQPSVRSGVPLRARGSAWPRGMADRRAAFSDR